MSQDQNAGPHFSLLFPQTGWGTAQPVLVAAFLVPLCCQCLEGAQDKPPSLLPQHILMPLLRGDVGALAWGSAERCWGLCSSTGRRTTRFHPVTLLKVALVLALATLSHVT